MVKKPKDCFNCYSDKDCILKPFKDKTCNHFRRINKDSQMNDINKKAKALCDMGICVSMSEARRKLGQMNGEFMPILMELLNKITDIMAKRHYMFRCFKAKSCSAVNCSHRKPHKWNEAKTKCVNICFNDGVCEPILTAAQEKAKKIWGH